MLAGETLVKLFYLHFGRENFVVLHFNALTLKTWANCWTTVKFANVFHCQCFAPYSTDYVNIAYHHTNFEGH